MNANKKASYAVWAVVILCAVTMITVAEFFRRPDAFRVLAAAAIGAQYNGDSGVTRQTSNTNCGAAAVKMIFDHHGIATPLKEIETDACFSERGASMFGLKRLAEKNTLRADGWKLTYAMLERQRFPVILFVTDDHFVVADSVCDDEIFIRDPAIGRLRISRRNLLKIWKGEALIFFGRNNAPAGPFDADNNIHP